MKDRLRLSDEDIEGEPAQLSCSQRWFGPLHPGGFRASLLALCSSMIGVGFLTLPEIGRKSGLYPMIGYIILAASMSVFGNWQIGRGFHATGAKTYAKIVGKVHNRPIHSILGFELNRASSLVSMIFLLLYVYVSAGAYYIFGANFAKSVVDNLNIRPSWAKNDDDFMNYFILFFYVVCFLGSLPSKITALRYFTFITALINLYLGVISSLRQNYIDQQQAEYPESIIDRNLFGSFCLSMFSSVNQFSVVSVLAEYQRPSARRIDKVISASPQLVLRSPYIPLVIYMAVAIGGFYTCGNKCPAIIINRDRLDGLSDLYMDIAKFALLVCLVVGIIIRNQSNKSAIFGILDQYQKLGEDDHHMESTNQQQQTMTDSRGDEKSPLAGGSRLSDQLRRASTQILNEKIDQTPAPVMLLIQFVNATIPAAVAILVKDNLVTYVEGGTGFLAPVFIIIYPCLITIKLHQRGVSPISPTAYIGVWIYLVVGSTLCYLTLVMNFYYQYIATDSPAS